MAEKEVNVKLRLRTDSAGNWLKANPVLLLGEIGIEADTGKIKIGDGTTVWRTLPYCFVHKDEILDLVYPVNSVKITLTDDNPGDSIGGVWQKAVGTQMTELKYWVRKE